MRHVARLLLLAAITSLLGACSTGAVKRVSAPTASLQQLTVQDSGQWQLEIRLHNSSSMTMQFGPAALTLSSGDLTAGKIDSLPAITIGPESADIVSLTLHPSPEARLLAASVLADKRSLPYHLQGELSAGPKEKRLRSWSISTRSTLHPAPGLPGVLR